MICIYPYCPNFSVSCPFSILSNALTSALMLSQTLMSSTLILLPDWFTKTVDLQSWIFDSIGIVLVGSWSFDISTRSIPSCILVIVPSMTVSRPTAAQSFTLISHFSYCATNSVCATVSGSTDGAGAVAWGVDWLHPASTTAVIESNHIESVFFMRSR